MFTFEGRQYKINSIMKAEEFIKKNEKLRTKGRKKSRQREEARAKTSSSNSSDSQRETDDEEGEGDRSTKGVETRKQKLLKNRH